METQIQSLHFTARPSLRNFIFDKMDTLEKLYDRLEAAMVILKLDKTQKKENKKAEISLRMPGLHLFAKDKAETFEEAVALAIDEIKRQLQKHKDKLNNVQPNGREVIETDIY